MGQDANHDIAVDNMFN